MELMYKTDENTPPPFEGRAAYFERSPNPFSRKMIVAALDNEKLPKQPETGWMAIDWCENPIGFIADGSEFKADEKPEFELCQGFFADGRMFAYSKEAYSLELKRNHEKEAAKLRNENKNET